MPSLKQFLFGADPKYKQLSTQTPQQQALSQQLLRGLSPGLGGGLGYLSDLYSNDPSTIQRMQQPYLQQFEQQIVPGIAERFSSLGGQNSSAFRNALLNAGSTLESQLAQQREGMKMQGLSPLLSYFNQGMAPSFENLGYGEQQGLIPSLVGNLPLLLQFLGG